MKKKLEQCQTKKLNLSYALTPTSPSPSNMVTQKFPLTQRTFLEPSPGSADKSPQIKKALFTVSDAAAYLGVEQETVYWMVSVGQLASIRIGKKGRSIRIPKVVLDTWIQASITDK